MQRYNFFELFLLVRINGSLILPDILSPKNMATETQPSDTQIQDLNYELSLYPPPPPPPPPPPKKNKRHKHPPQQQTHPNFHTLPSKTKTKTKTK
ncbi:MAG: hypothetical protein FWG84_10735, partial [Bacteroidales bacterium]|nr:hypothetical protein [Bacteroidales bacterium]